ncbi:MAG: glycine cleavage system protein H [Thermoanaerobaculia bacterium]|nr:glycine cleavage system protein H [Thermoanaerobaculia bacterium]
MVLESLAPADFVRYRRHRFVAKFPRRYLYSPAHFWLAEDEGVWHVGLTHFAVRMLGEIVEFDVERQSGDPLELGEVIGWVEGMKALTDLYSIAEGTLVEVNAESLGDPELLCKEPYAAGWIYCFEGRPDTRCTDVETYLENLGETLDAMGEEPWRQGVG